MTNRSGQLAAAVVALLAPALVAGVALLLGGDVPDPVPTHWNLSGEVDGTASFATLTAVVATVTGLATAAALVLVAGVRRGVDRAAGAAALTWLAWLSAVLYAATLGAAEGAATATEVDLPVGIVLLAMVVPVAAAALVHKQLPRHVATAVAAPTSSMELADGERAVWVGSASSRPMLVAGVVLAVAALPLWFAAWPAAIVATVAAVAMSWLHAVSVRVDDAAVSVSWGPLLWPRVGVALERVASATAEDVDPLRWGGWGYRRTLGGRAAVVRRGPGLVLALTDGQRFAVTVDAPEPAADLVNAVLARSAR
ncbi:DUF1648 domain-containing protein [Nocardioides sp. J54]|uniref:DUF1648 domain-containing protein n=1 Tax=Nocardioides sp. J54 TaxID=935866 RepID=UPI0004B1B6CB|nr:DUF1648 domain-containing protein [Nocardioides sp. J54]